MIERSQAQQANPGHHASPDERANTPEPDREHEHQADQPAELQPGAGETAIDSEIQQTIEAQQDRQQDWENGIEPDQENDRDNDIGFGIE